LLIAVAMKKILIIIFFVPLAIAFTWNVVSWSKQHAKLAVPPDYDDSITMVEAGIRTLALQEALGHRVVFQLDQREPAPQTLFRHEPERGENANLDRDGDLPDGGGLALGA
jgi:hypothetical protein